MSSYHLQPSCLPLSIATLRKTSTRNGGPIDSDLIVLRKKVWKHRTKRRRAECVSTPEWYAVHHFHQTYSVWSSGTARLIDSIQTRYVTTYVKKETNKKKNRTTTWLLSSVWFSSRKKSHNPTNSASESDKSIFTECRQLRTYYKYILANFQFIVGDSNIIFKHFHIWSS